MSVGNRCERALNCSFRALSVQGGARLQAVDAKVLPLKHQRVGPHPAPKFVTVNNRRSRQGGRGRRNGQRPGTVSSVSGHHSADLGGAMAASLVFRQHESAQHYLHKSWQDIALAAAVTFINEYFDFPMVQVTILDRDEQHTIAAVGTSPGSPPPH